MPSNPDNLEIGEVVQVMSNTKPGVAYSITHTGDGEFSCTCPSNNVECSHVKKIKSMLSGEGKRINAHLLKISKALIYIDSGLKLGQDVSILVNGTVKKTEDEDNDDGTFNRVYIIKGVNAILIKNGE